MMTPATSLKQMSSLCPHQTADAVAILRLCIEGLGIDFTPSDGQEIVEYVVSKLQKALSKAIELEAGRDFLVMIAWKATPIDHPNSTDWLFVNWDIFHYETVYCAVEAAAQLIERRPSRKLDGPAENDVTVASSFVVTPPTVASGQLSYPQQLIDELDLVAGACRESAAENYLGFLRKLEEACMNAHANGSTAAGVAIYHTPQGAEMVSVHGDDRGACDVQAERSRRGSRCVSIPVRQHEEMR